MALRETATARVAATVNGAAAGWPASPGRSLLETLREELGLTGAKYGCGEGVCGACTVLIDGRPERACLVPAGLLDRRRITTVEGLGDAEGLHPVQAAFAEVGAAQCGYCTPGMVLSAVALLDRHAHPSDADIVTAMNGNICRCCAYQRILAAVRRAAETPHSAVPVARPADGTVPLPHVVPWDLHPVHERDYFSVLGDGLVVVVPREPDERAWRPGSIGGGAWLHVGADGLVTVFTGKVNVGQGTKAALALLAAEELGVGLDHVRVVMGDTDLCPYDAGTFGSRGMPVAGRATRLAAAAARVALGRLGHALEGKRILEVVPGDGVPPPPSGWATAGRRRPDPWTWAAVTGGRRFPTDLTRDGLLQGRVVRPPAIGARPVTTDLSGVDAVPGAFAIAEDAMVAVAAPDFRTATEAAGRIRVEWERTAQPSEAGLADHLRTHPVDVEGWGGAELHSQGDAGRALAQAASVSAETYTTAYIAHAPLETRAALAEWDSGRLTVWVGTQTPFILRQALAEAFGLGEERVRVVVPDTGGGFGGKHSAETALCAARLARRSGRPVKVRWTREEEFRWAYFRPAAVIDVASGLDGDGRLIAWTFTNINSGSAAMRCPYDVPSQRISFQPAASPLPQGAYRSLAAVANTFARECHIDRVARRVRRDPVDFRLDHLSDPRLRAVLEAVAERAGWPRPALGGALGIAVGVEKGSYVATCAEMALAGPAGLEVRRIVTAFECGAIVDPRSLRAQVEGATVMGLGGALFEAVHFDDGTIQDASFAQYRVPRFGDVPPIDVLLLDRRDIEPAGGGETPITAIAPALANAILAAGGGERNALPLLP